MHNRKILLRRGQQQIARVANRVAVLQRAEIGHPLQFVIGQFDAEMILQFGQKIERLQAVLAEFPALVTPG